MNTPTPPPPPATPPTITPCSTYGAALTDIANNYTTTPDSHAIWSFAFPDNDLKLHKVLLGISTQYNTELHTQITTIYAEVPDLDYLYSATTLPLSALRKNTQHLPELAHTILQGISKDINHHLGT